MRRLTVTEYLIAQNQAQTTVTTYARFGDAINEAMQWGRAGHAPIIECMDAVPASQPLELGQIDTYHLRNINGDVFAYVHAWAAGDYAVYTVQRT